MRRPRAQHWCSHCDRIASGKACNGSLRQSPCFGYPSNGTFVCPSVVSVVSAQWAHYNNLKLNGAKSVEVIFTGSTRNAQDCSPPVLPGISRVTTIATLGVTVADRTAADRTRLNSFLRRCMKLGYYSSNDPPTISSIADDIEDTLFKSILRNAQHVSYLEERPQLHYNLRNRPGINKTLIEKTVDLNDRDF